MTTKLILTSEVSGLGTAGDIVEVKDGYARNYLLPRSLATPWTKGGQRQLDQIRSARSKRSIESLEEAQALRDLLQSKPVVVSERAGENGRLFGAVSTKDVAEGVKAEADSVRKTIDNYRASFRRLVEGQVQVLKDAGSLFD